LILRDYHWITHGFATEDLESGINDGSHGDLRLNSVLIYKAQEDVSKLLKASAPAVEILEN
jgi:hypothetical protein